MVDDGEFAVSLLDFELRRRGLDTERVIICRVDNHVFGFPALLDGGQLSSRTEDVSVLGGKEDQVGRKRLI